LRVGLYVKETVSKKASWSSFLLVAWKWAFRPSVMLLARVSHIAFHGVRHNQLAIVIRIVGGRGGTSICQVFHYQGGVERCRNYIHAQHGIKPWESKVNF
jgi:hypothetical protein